MEEHSEEKISSSNQSSTTDKLDADKQLNDMQIKKQAQYYKRKRYLASSNIFQTIFFTWISNLISFGNKIEIVQEAVPHLIQQHKPKVQFDQLYTTFNNLERSPTKGMTLTKAILKTFKSQFLMLLFIATLTTILQIIQPILTHEVIDYIQNGERNIKTGIIYFSLIFFVTIVISLLMSQIYFIFGILGFNLSNSLSLMIYHKTLKHPLITEKQFTIGDIINYSQVDAQRMTYLGFQLVALLITPFQLIAMMFLLFQYIGPVFLIGIGIMIFMMLFTLIFTKKAAEANDQLLKKKDARMKVTEEILQIIKFIKINALEKYFFEKLNAKRQQQLSWTRRVQLLTVATILVYWVCPGLIVGVTFLVYIKLNYQLTPQLAFVVIILFNILQYPIRLLPTSISQIIQIWSSVKRIENYLVASELSEANIERYNYQGQEYAIQIENGNFLWGVEKKKKQENKEDSHKNLQNNSQDSLKQSLLSEEIPESQTTQDQYFVSALKNINIKFKTGEIVMIIGDIGSGKSSLLYAILNQMTSDPVNIPSIKINGSLAYCPQKPWIMSGTVKDNILFCKPYDQKKLERAIHYACLDDDIKILGKGIETEIGQKGVNLSGGQKARVSLARALYSENDIYLLDDILSAVDVHVGTFIMQQTMGVFLKGKTVILPTHAINYADKADKVIIMKKGRIINSGSYKQISQTSDFLEIKQLESKKKEKGQQENKQESSILKEQKMINEVVKEDTGLSKEKNKENKSLTDQLVETLIIPEDKVKGKVDIKIYKKYVSLNGGWIFVIAVIGFISGWAVLSTLSNIEIEHWCEDPVNSEWHIYLYMGLATVASFSSAIRAYILVSSGVRQGRIVHRGMIKSLLYASLVQFYNRVPVGRILNRLSKDLRELDEAIGYAVGNLLVSLFRLLAGIAMCFYASTPLIAIPCFLVGYLCMKINTYYLNAQRACIRLQNISSSPIVSGFTSAVNGVATIRSYGFQEEFFLKQIERIQVNKRNRIAREAMESWFSMRLSFLSFVINMGAILYCILSDNGNGSLAGLLLTYSLSVNSDLVDTIFAYASLETKMIAIERVTKFTQIEPEEGYTNYMESWFTQNQGYDENAIKKGRLTFNNFYLRYRKDLPIVLNNISITIEAGKKIGVAGRTGAGKSTLLSSILRIVDGSQGTLQIDGKDIKQYNLKDLRSCVTMIDQEPILIQGSFRQNLDPTKQFSESELQEILKQCSLWQLVLEKGGLQSLISNQSLSVGQRQLLCICRAFLKKSKIVLIDEATANIDVKTDQTIQKIINEKFKENTVITVAHRLSTIQNYDKILILGEGKVLEWGNTEVLLEDKDSIFSKMIKEKDDSYLK